MEISSVNATVPTDRQTMATENREPKPEETTETRPQESREAYRVDISTEAQKKLETAASQEPPPPPPETPEPVSAYTNAGRLAG